MKITKTTWLSLVLALGITVPAAKAQKAGTRIDWNKLEAHYKKQGDAVRSDLLNFLHAHISCHYTDHYVWQDSLKREIAFDELDYPDFNASLQAFEQLKKQYGSLSAVPTRREDGQVISEKDIRECIDATYPYASVYPGDILSEYLLPYRVITEPVYSWRAAYKERFSGTGPGAEKDDLRSVITRVTDNMNQWFICTYNLEKRPDPIPYLGSLQLLHRKKGGCEDAANLMTFALRSLGIPCAVDVIPYWGTSTGGHFLNTAFDRNGRPVHFDALIDSDSLYEMIREPAKVFRLTYSADKRLLSSRIPLSRIPPNGLLREKCYKDVTDEYWRTRDLEFDIEPGHPDSVIYASVYNGGRWRPVWYGIRKDSTVVMDKLCEGVVYAPTVYEHMKNTGVGDPVAFSGDSIIRFRPLPETHDIRVYELERYLKFKVGKIYTLYYYDKKWIKHQKKIPCTGCKFLSFQEVPKGALLLLRCEESNNKERPFTMDDQGQRSWW